MLLKVCSLKVVILYTEGKKNYHSLQILLPFHWTRAHHVTCKKLPKNNGLLMRKSSNFV